MSSYPLWWTKCSQWFKNPQSAETWNVSRESVKVRKWNAFMCFSFYVSAQRVNGISLTKIRWYTCKCWLHFQKEVLFFHKRPQFQTVLCNFELQIIHMPRANQFSNKLVFCIFSKRGQVQRFLLLNSHYLWNIQYKCILCSCSDLLFVALHRSDIVTAPPTLTGVKLLQCAYSYIQSDLLY